MPILPRNISSKEYIFLSSSFHLMNFYFPAYLFTEKIFIPGGINMDNNIIYAEDVNKDSSVLANADFKALQKKNYDVFCDKFSKEAFIKQYQEFFKKYAK